MADTTTADLRGPERGTPLWRRIDRVWLIIGLTYLGLVLWRPPVAWGVAEDNLAALLSTLPFILFAVAALGWLKATGAEAVVARAFQGREGRMIVLAALAGGLSPFCSCEVIPFIAALLAAGVPLSAVMAFWLASPLMDPAMFAIVAGALGTEMAVAKLISAVGIAMVAGFAVKAFSTTPLFAEPLKAEPVRKGCGCGAPKAEAPVWRFWQDRERRATFADAAWTNFLFLMKWLAFAYLIEVLMIRYLPAEWIALAVGGEGIFPVITAAVVGAPAYLNGYAAPALVSGLMEGGMSAGAGLSFMIAGGVTCVPAAVAVWALVKPRVFGAYVGFGFAGAVASGLVLNAIT